jgi:hypothetical protein
MLVMQDPEGSLRPSDSDFVVAVEPTYTQAPRPFRWPFGHLNPWLYVEHLSTERARTAKYKRSRVDFRPPHKGCNPLPSGPYG